MLREIESESLLVAGYLIKYGFIHSLSAADKLIDVEGISLSFYLDVVELAENKPLA